MKRRLYIVDWILFIVIIFDINVIFLFFIFFLKKCTNILNEKLANVSIIFFVQIYKKRNTKKVFKKECKEKRNIEKKFYKNILIYLLKTINK